MIIENKSPFICVPP
uniref:Uncharacterized protein n=1 Tax=Anguilla anguilla TaxID=7936 RepID=A0A0E9P8M7_ANGAN